MGKQRSRTVSCNDLNAWGYTETSPGVFERTKKPSEPQQLDPAQAKKELKKAQRPEGLQAIERILNVAGIEYLNEHVYSSKRRFRFDIAIPSLMVAVEYEGIFSDKSRHTNVKGYTEDTTKYNLAKCEGWTVLRYTAKNYKNFLEDFKQLITTK